MNVNLNVLSCLLKQFFGALSEHEIDYCVIGNYHGLPDYTSNDVDVWVNDVPQAESILLALAKDCGLVLYMRNKTANGSNNYFYRETTQNDFEIVKIDLMHEVAYRSIIPIIESDLIRANRKLYNSFFVANDELEAVLHLIYPLVTFGIVKEKYREKLKMYAQNTRFVSCVRDVLSLKLAEKILRAVNSSDWGAVERTSNAVRARLMLRALLSFGGARAKIVWDFLNSLARRSIQKNGIVVAFTGIDGAGKTTIKDALVQHSNKFFPKQNCVQYYWRPFLLPRISAFFGGRGQVEEYSQRGVRVVNSSAIGKLKGLLKYFYYVLDFNIGQAKYFRVSHTGGLVVFDRYHFDNIVYPERFGFVVNKNMMRFVDRYFIPQPDMLFYFTASTDSLYNRKMELAKEEIESQKSAYESEIQGNGNVYVICTDGAMDDSLNAVLLACFRKMSERHAWQP